jgi:cytochrome c oxidase subunit 4
VGVFVSTVVFDTLSRKTMHHVVPRTTYFIIFIWLAALLALTVLAAHVNLGMWNVPVALAIAMVKAALIVLFFMHVRYGSPLLKLFAAGGFFWLMIMLAFVLTDVWARQS